MFDWNRIIVPVALLWGLAGPVFASDEITLEALSDADYEITRDGAVQLICEREADGQLFLARAALLDLPGYEGGEYLLTARHAVSDGAVARLCRVRGVPVRFGAVTATEGAELAEGQALEFEQDWALLRTAMALPGEHRRLPLAAFDVLPDGEVSLLKPAIVTEPCALLEPPEEEADPRLIFHSCDSLPGMSGTPLVALVAGEPHIVGIHLGGMIYLDRDGARYSVARRVSDEVVTALLAAVETQTTP